MIKPPIRMLIGRESIQFIPTMYFDKQLTLDRNNYRILPNQPLLEIQQEIGIYGIVGVYNVNGKLNLFYISEAIRVCTINCQEIFQIEAISNILQNSLTPVEQQFTSRIEGYLTKCTYFSLTYDLTLPLAQQNQPDQGERSMRYWWNLHGYKLFLTQNIPKCWCTKIIQGFVGIGSSLLQTEKQHLFYILIARRETLRGGTRYNHRGINIEGAAANTIETESLIQYQDKLYCHIQIRGSVPVFWEQKGIRAISQLTQNQEQTKMALTKHIMNLKKTYGPLLLVDLMAKDKPNEYLISKTYSDILAVLQIAQTQHCHIDFNQYCKNYKFQHLNPLINEHKKTLNLHSFTKFQSDKISNIQNGIVRTNCLDCLDRTNVFQTKIAFFVTNLILNDIGINIPKEFRCETILDLVIIALIQSDKEHVHTLIKVIKFLWGEAGDNISNIYAGTNSSTTKIQKTGGSSWTGMFEHGIKGFHRFFNQNITDDEKQSVYKFIVGQDSSLNKDFLSFIEQISQQSPIKNSNLLIMAISYNAKGKQMQDFYHLIDARQYYLNIHRIPQLIIIQFQNVDKTRQSLNFMRDHLSAAIRSQLGVYECIISTLNVQKYCYFQSRNYGFIFSKQNAAISKIQELQITIENQDIAILQQFKYEECTIQAINFNITYKEIETLEKKIQEESQKYGKPEISFIFGITDSKIQIEQTVEDYQEKYKTDVMNYFYLEDELGQGMQKIDLLKPYKEQVITFMPRNKQWQNRILYGYLEDAFNPLIYEEAAESGVRLLISVDLKLLELKIEKIVNEEEREDIGISQQFYQWSDNEDDFEILT